MHWLTAIFGFVSVYSLAGWLYLFVRGAAVDGLWFCAIAFVITTVLGIANEVRCRRNAAKIKAASTP